MVEDKKNPDMYRTGFGPYTSASFPANSEKQTEPPSNTKIKKEVASSAESATSKEKK